MTKGTTVRHRDKKKSSATNHFTETTSRDVSSSHGSTENLRDKSLWRYCIFVILLSVGSVSLFCLKDTELFSRTLRSIKARRAFSSADHGEELPCNFGDDFIVDRRSNLSLDEFIRCYDAKRY